MNKYELALILNSTLDEETRIAKATKVQELITKFGGTIEKIDDWGKKKLAYEIRRLQSTHTEGFFSFITFDSDGSAPAEIERRIRIMEDSVIRFLIIRKDV